MGLSPYRDARRRAGKSRLHWLLLVPILVGLANPLYNRMEPRLFGFPFFYWSQLALVGFALIISATVSIIAGKRR